MRGVVFTIVLLGSAVTVFAEPWPEPSGLADVHAADGHLGYVEPSGLDPAVKQAGPGGAVVDVLVVYSKQLAVSDTLAGLEATFRQQIEDTTADALARSSIPHRFRVVAVEPVAWDETTDQDDLLLDEINWIRESSQVATLRRVHKADVAFLALAEHEEGIFGRAFIGARAAVALGVFVSEHDSIVAAHELGHIVGAQHQIDIGFAAAPFTGSAVHGYIWPNPAGGTLSSIMAAGANVFYGSPPERYLGYADPTVLHNGVPTGVPGVSDVAAMLNDTMPQVAEFSQGRLRTCSNLARDFTLCFHGGRFQATLSWRDRRGNTGGGKNAPLATDEAGLFWFFSPENWELLVKVIDGCSFNNRFWVFFGGATDVRFDLWVQDLFVPQDESTGVGKRYINPLGRPANAVTDTKAIATCGRGLGG